jgi:hypothetical protein
VNFYEELGVPPDATPETIRDAYRNAARLLHPDLQTDPDLKESAETRMKRLNHVYAILSHAGQRRRYDLELAGSAPRVTPVIVEVERFDRGRGGTLVWIAATAVCAALILWLGIRESSSSPAVYSGASLAENPAVKAPIPTPAKTAAPVKPAAPQRADELAVLRGQLLAADAGLHKREESKAVPLENLTPAPLAVSQHNQDVLPAASLPRVEAPAVATWSGSWTYAGSGAGDQTQGLLPPEFIIATIREENGRIRGQYHARFKVKDARISPVVNFQFEGAVSGNTARLPWSGDGSAKGEVQLRLISATALEINWSAATLGKTMGLDSGTAILNKKN